MPSLNHGSLLPLFLAVLLLSSFTAVAANHHTTHRQHYVVVPDNWTLRVFTIDPGDDAFDVHTNDFLGAEVYILALLYDAEGNLETGAFGCGGILPTAMPSTVTTVELWMADKCGSDVGIGEVTLTTWTA